MSYVYSQDPKIWLSSINKRFRLVKEGEHGDVVERRCLEDPEIQKIPKTVHGFRAGKPFDLVIVGPCSGPFSGLEENTPEFPMGRSGQDSYLHEVVKREKPKAVLLYAGCCGTYPEWYKELIRGAFPDIGCILPDMADLFDNEMNVNGIRYLIHNGILVPVD